MLERIKFQSPEEKKSKKLLKILKKKVVFFIAKKQILKPVRKNDLLISWEWK